MALARKPHRSRIAILLMAHECIALEDVWARWLKGVAHDQYVMYIHINKPMEAIPLAFNNSHVNHHFIQSLHVSDTPCFHYIHIHSSL
jgi:hypothetical protein